MLDQDGFFEDWLPEVAADPILVDASPEGLFNEADTNRWSFHVTREQAWDMLPDQVLNFISAVRKARNRQILDRFGKSHPMTMYWWTDEQAGYLKFSLVSTSHGELPSHFPRRVPLRPPQETKPQNRRDARFENLTLRPCFFAIPPLLELACEWRVR